MSKEKVSAFSLKHFQGYFDFVSPTLGTTIEIQVPNIGRMGFIVWRALETIEQGSLCQVNSRMGARLVRKMKLGGLAGLALSSLEKGQIGYFWTGDK